MNKTHSLYYIYIKIENSNIEKVVFSLCNNVMCDFNMYRLSGSTSDELFNCNIYVMIPISLQFVTFMLTFICTVQGQVPSSPPPATRAPMLLDDS
jgi:hypothetical protein